MHLAMDKDYKVMLAINCGDVGLFNCEYIAKGNTEREVMEDEDLHARQVHDLGPGGLPPEWQKKLKSLIYTV
jgi:predicted small metal-binding protein